MRKTTALVALAAASLAPAGCGGDTASVADSAGSGGGAAIEVDAGDLYFAPEPLSANAGEVSVTLDNVGAAAHDVVIEELDDLVVAHAAPGETVTGTVTLEAGGGPR